MQKHRPHRPSAAMVVAILALVVAASGTAVAAGHLVNGDSLIRKHSLSGNRIRNNTITRQQINLKKLGPVPNASNANHATSADQATTATTAGSAPISRLDYESTNVTLNQNGPVAGAASCPTGLNATGGGASVSDESNDFIIDTAPDGRNGWHASGYGGDGQTMTIYVICAPAATTTP